MEPENTPLEKEKSSSKPSFSGSILIFRGVFVSIGPFVSDLFATVFLSKRPDVHQVYEVTT